MKKQLISAIVATAPTLAMATTTVNFDTLSLDGSSYWDGSGGGTGFSDSGVRFGAGKTDWGTWTGWGYSNVNDTSTLHFTNDHASITGTDLSNSGKYGVCYLDGSAPKSASAVNLPITTAVMGMYVTNTTYTALAMRDGFFNAKKFGGASGNDPDWLKLTITGYSGATPTGFVDLYLADYRFADNAQDYIVTDWRWVDLSSLGNQTTSLNFTMSSTDNDPTWGMNTPSYFAMDDLTVDAVPEPTAISLLVLGSLALLKRRRG